MTSSEQNSIEIHTDISQSTQSLICRAFSREKTFCAQVTFVLGN